MSEWLDVESGHDALLVRNIRAPKWSTQDFELETVSFVKAPVSWQDGVLHNDAGAAFAETVLLVGDQVFDLGPLSPSGTIRLDGRSGHALLPSVRRTDTAGAETLDRAFAFSNRAQIKKLMRTVRGVFVGLVEEDGRDFSLEPAAERRRSFTVHVHLFEAL
jgi:hypothetical protein